MVGTCAQEKAPLGGAGCAVLGVVRLLVGVLLQTRAPWKLLVTAKQFKAKLGHS